MRVVIGIKNIAAAWNVSVPWLYRRRKELMDCGALIRFVQGRPPRAVIHGITERFYAWAAVKQTRGEKL